LIKPKEEQRSEPIITRSSLSKAKTAERRETAASSKKQTKPSHPPSLPRRKGEVRSLPNATKMLLLLLLSSKLDRSKGNRGYHHHLQKEIFTFLPESRWHFPVLKLW
jgi:hypothetical protein